MPAIASIKAPDPSVLRTGVPPIIVADDDDTARRVHSRILRTRGFVTKTAAGAADVLALLGETPGAIVVTDYCMPTTDGLSLIDKARKLDPSVVFVMVTGMTTLDPQEVSSGRAALFKVVFKPVDALELVDVVEQAIQYQRKMLAPSPVAQAKPAESWPRDILVVDADSTAHERITSALSSLGGAVRNVATLAEGLSLLRERDIDLVVYDMAVPDGEGAAGIERIRQTCTTSAILATSRRSDDGVLHQALRKGAHEFVGVTHLDALAGRRAALRARERKLAELDLVRAAQADPGRPRELSLGDVSQKRLAERLRASVAAREFAIHLQAQIGLRAGVVEGAEALVRWTPKEGEAAHPGIFIPVLEDTGLINKVGDLVFELACDRVAEWRKIGRYPGRVSVNLSAQQFEDPDLVGRFVDIARSRGVTPDALELEITESMLLKNMTHCEQMLHAFKDMGFRIALDDFGTGYSSLAYLHRLPVDVLKIDRSMVMALGTGKQVETICSAMIELGRKLGLEVIAEGVETVDQMLFLRDAGAHKGQGFLMARPTADFSPHKALESEPKWKAALLDVTRRAPMPTPMAAPPL